MTSFDLVRDLHLDMRREPLRMLMDIEPQSAVLVIAGDLCESRNISQDWIDVLCNPLGYPHEGRRSIIPVKVAL